MNILAEGYTLARRGIFPVLDFCIRPPDVAFSRPIAVHLSYISTDLLEKENQCVQIDADHVGGSLTGRRVMLAAK